MVRRNSLPPGFRFSPTDVELIKYYLKRKVMGKRLLFNCIAEVDINKYAPWDLPEKSILRTGDLKWYFFSPREKKYSSGSRMKRAADMGYWKTTGKDREVKYNNEVVGMIKTLVFHRGKAPKGERTDWVMYEYRLQEKGLVDKGVAQDAYVLCSLFKKDGPGPRNGAQYGAPFNEEDWNSDDEEELTGTEGTSSAGVSTLAEAVLNQNSSLVTSLCVPGTTSMLPTATGPSQSLPSASNTVGVANNDSAASAEPLQFGNEENDDFGALLDNFLEATPFNLGEIDMNEVTENGDQGGNIINDSWMDGRDIFHGLGDLGNLGALGNYEVYESNVPFLELEDLDAPLSDIDVLRYNVYGAEPFIGDTNRSVTSETGNASASELTRYEISETGNASASEFTRRAVQHSAPPPTGAKWRKGVKVCGGSSFHVKAEVTLWIRGFVTQFGGVFLLRPTSTC